MEQFREFMKNLMEVIPCEFRSLQIVKWTDNKIDMNYWICKEYVTADDVNKIEKVLHQFNMRLIGHMMFFPDTSMERMNIRISLPLEDHIKPYKLV